MVGHETWPSSEWTGAPSCEPADNGYGRRMDDEPCNAASKAGEDIAALAFDYANPDELLSEVLSRVAEDFVQQDRRKLVGSTSEIGKAEYAQVAAFFLREASLESRDQKVLAVRGDHLMLARIVDRFGDGSMREFLAIAYFVGDPLQERLAVMFDPDDLDLAMTELDRLHAEIEAGNL